MPGSAIDDPAISPLAFRILAHIAARPEGSQLRFHPLVAYLSNREAYGNSEHVIRAALGELLTEGYIKVADGPDNSTPCIVEAVEL